jgi:hypothetical protein
MLVNIQNGGPYGRRTKAGYDISEDLQIVNSDILWLLSHLCESTVKLSTWRKVPLPLIEWLQLNGASCMEHHQKPAPLVCCLAWLKLISNSFMTHRQSLQTRLVQVMTLVTALHPVS